jgi:tripartite-type tricarboxylate transporter receptor subunit TctC
LPHIQAGKLRALAYNDNKRLAQAPNVPTAKEQGIDVIDHFWRSILVPKGTPPSVINKLAAAFKKITEDPSFVEMIKKFGEEVNYLGPEEFTKMWKEEYESRKQLAKLYKK